MIAGFPSIVPSFKATLPSVTEWRTIRSPWRSGVVELSLIALAEPVSPKQAAASRVKRDDGVAGQGDELPPAAMFGDNRRGIAGGIVEGFPRQFALFAVVGHERLAGSADHDHDAVAVDDW